jgi:hypothetical protein
MGVITVEQAYVEFSDSELRKLLRDFGLPSGGSRSELLARLDVHGQAVVARNAEIDGWN